MGINLKKMEGINQKNRWNGYKSGKLEEMGSNEENMKEMDVN